MIKYHYDNFIKEVKFVFMNIEFFGAFYSKKEPVEFHMYRPYGTPGYLLLHFSDPLVIVIGNKTITTEKNACIIYKPGTYQEYYSLPGGFTNDYVIFLPDEESFMRTFNVPLDEIFYIKNGVSISEYAEYITWAMTDMLNDNSERMKESLTAILNILAEQRIFSSPREQRANQSKNIFINLREEVKKQPSAWTVDKMAKSVYLTRSYFNVLYNEYFKNPPSDDLINFKLDFAKKLLSETNDSIGKIAKKCGYNNSENFIRLFKKKEGTTPGKFRKPKKN